MNDANSSWLNLLADLITSGNATNPRGRETKELLARTSMVDMERPVVSIKRRKLGYKFMLAEALWILSGDSRVSTIAPFSKHISSFSDNGLFFQGAYGPMVVQQLDYVVSALKEDTSTRQAVMTIWRPNPRPSKDIPCTVSLQWLIRRDQLFCLDTMRSSDVWLGWPYDVFNFSMVSAFIVLALRCHGVYVQLGKLILTAGSQHLYSSDTSEAVNCIIEPKTFEYKALNVSEFGGPESLLRHLNFLLEEKCSDEGDFLNDLYASVKASKGHVEGQAGVGDAAHPAGDRPNQGVPDDQPPTLR